MMFTKYQSWEQYVASVCRKSVLQDSVCVLEQGHSGHHQDREGFQKCCKCGDEFTTWGHRKDCPYASI